MQFVRARQTTLVHPQLVVQNVWLALNVLKIKHVSTKNALTHVLEPVDLTLDVKWSTTIQYVVVQLDILAIRLSVAYKKVRVDKPLISKHVIK